ncbi:MAG: dTDP-glucose 4,6-dehydratase [Planctomycetota bacterium]|jgi:dTDP-glucose 4,6-dehydratase
MSRTLLVTGGCGFIGSNFVRAVLGQRRDWSVVNLDALTYAGNLESLRDVEGDPRYRFIHGDVRNRSVVDAAIRGCDTVVHFAAESHVDRSLQDSTPFISTNVEGTQVMLDAAVAAGVDRFVQIGTDEVYGELPLDRPELRFTESTPLAPRSPYAASKAAADLLALAAHRTFDLPVIVTRCSNNFGPYQFPEKVIPLFVTNLFEGKTVPLYGDGRNVRDWLHVEDHCAAVLAALERGTPGEVYNIGGDNERSNLELTHLLLELCGCDERRIEPVTDRLGHDRRYAIDASKAHVALAWSPVHADFRAALAETVDWYRANEAWWKPLAEARERT